MTTRTRASRRKTSERKTIAVIDLTREVSYEDILQTAVTAETVTLEDSLSVPPAPESPTSGTPRKQKRKKEKVKTSTAAKKKKNGIGDCAICLEERINKHLCATKCGHVFCLVCLMQTLEMNPMCPTCRTDLKGAGAYHSLYL